MGRRRGDWSTVQNVHHRTPKTQEAKHELWQSWGDSALQRQGQVYAVHGGFWSLPPSSAPALSCCGWVLGYPTFEVAKGADSGLGRSGSEQEEFPGLNLAPSSRIILFGLFWDGWYARMLGTARAPQKAHLVPAAWGHSRGQRCQTDVAQEQGCWALVSEG